MVSAFFCKAHSTFPRSECCSDGTGTLICSTVVDAAAKAARINSAYAQAKHTQNSTPLPEAARLTAWALTRASADVDRGQYFEFSIARSMVYA